MCEAPTCVDIRWQAECVDHATVTQRRAGFTNNAGLVLALELCRIADKVSHKKQATELKLTMREAAYVSR